MIIIVDLDFTLLNDEGKLTNKTIEVLKKCKQQGHKIVINSARSYIRSIDIAKLIDADYINCFYGNLVLDNKGNTIFSRALDKKNTSKLIKDFQTIYNGFLAVETIDGGFTNSAEMAKRFGGVVASVQEIEKKLPFKLVFEIYEKDHDKARKIAEKYNLAIKFAREGYFCSLLPKDTDKANGIKKILTLKENAGEQSIAFGDEISDLKTFECVDVPVAMENSTQIIKESIKEKTLSNNQDGVAVYLQNVLTL